MKEIVIDARIIKHLGKDLITSSEVAVIELIKNAMDAKAKNISLRLYNGTFPTNSIPDCVIKQLIPQHLLNTPLLLVEDDGSGMTDKVLEQGFLTVGTSIKVADNDSLGEKGIGRLAAQRLGSALLLETSADEEAHTSFVFVNWEDVINGNSYVPSSL